MVDNYVCLNHTLRMTAPTATQETLNFLNRVLNDTILLLEEAKLHLAKLVALNPDLDQEALLEEIQGMEEDYEQLYKIYEEILSEELAYMRN